MKKSFLSCLIKLKAKHHINTGYFFRTSSNMMGGGWQLVMCRGLVLFFFFFAENAVLSRLQRKGPWHRLWWGVRAKRTEIWWKNCDSASLWGPRGASSLQWVHVPSVFLSVRAKRPNCGNYTWLWFQFFLPVKSCNPKEKESSFYIVKYFLKHCSEKVNFDNSDQENLSCFYKIKCFKTDVLGTLETLLARYIFL